MLNVEAYFLSVLLSLWTSFGETIERQHDGIRYLDTLPVNQTINPELFSDTQNDRTSTMILIASNKMTEKGEPPFRLSTPNDRQLLHPVKIHQDSMSGIWYKNNEDGSSNVSIMFLVRSGGIDFDREENRLLKDVFVGYLEDQFILERNFETRTPQIQFFVESQGFSTKIQAKNAKDMRFILETFFDLFLIDVDLEINRHIFDNRLRKISEYARRFQSTTFINASINFFSNVINGRTYFLHDSYQFINLILNDMKNFVDKFFVTVHFEFFFDGNIDKMTANQTIGSIINKTTLHFHSSIINELNVYPMKALPKKMVIRKSIQNSDHNCVMIAFKITSIYSSWDRFAGDLLDGFLSTDFVVKYQMQNQDHQIKYVRLPGIVGNYMLFLMTGNHHTSLLEQKLEDFLQTIISYVQHSEPGEFRKFANYAIMKYENRPMWFKNWFMIKKGYYDFDFHRNFAERLLMHNTRHVQEFIEKFLKSDAPTHARLTVILEK